MAWYGVVSGAIDSLAPFYVTGLIFGSPSINSSTSMPNKINIRTKFLMTLSSNVVYIHRFSYDSLNTVKDQQNIQESMLKDILDIAKIVQNGTSQCNQLVHSLGESTEVVNAAIREISTSTQVTADNIQEQSISIASTNSLKVQEQEKRARDFRLLRMRSEIWLSRLESQLRTLQKLLMN